MSSEISGHLKHISESIRAGLLEAPDALDILSNHLGFIQYTREPRNEVQYRIAQGDDVALTVVHEKDSVSEFREGPALSVDLAASIRNDIDAEIGFEGIEVSRMILFASVPTSNFWRYRDRVQIVPVPSQAPQPKWFIADHPLILEVAHRGTPNPRIGASRSQRELRRIGHLLGLVLRFNAQMQPRYSTNNWMIVSDESGSGTQFRSEFLQRGYAIPDWEFDRSSFTEPMWPPCDVIADGAYSSAPGISIDSTLNVPQCIDAVFDHYFVLGDDERNRFLRSCYWYYTGNEIWNSSQSASFIALVQAIEALLDGDDRTKRCEVCGRPLGPGPTKKFSDFLELYAAGTSKALRDRLYRMRSQLAHGGTLLSRDEGGFGFAGLHPTEVLERDDHAQLRGIARTALINWLLIGDPATYVQR